MNKFRYFPVLVVVIMVLSFTVPDYNDEQGHPAIGFWENKGQVLDAYGASAYWVDYYSEGGGVHLHFQGNSTVTYSMVIPDTSVSAPDTILNVRMFAAGPQAGSVSPVPFEEKPWVKHFYLPWCGQNGITDVKGYDVISYEEFIKNIDLHYHSGSGGMKMSLICHPGFDPDDLVLGFLGQDSLEVDVEGFLRMYSDGRWLQLRQAVAFQVDGNGDHIPLNWNAVYQPDQEYSTVMFQLDDYDPELPLILQVGPDPRADREVEGLCWSSYLGGSAEDHVFNSRVDAEGNYYVTGITQSHYSTFPNQEGIQLNFAPLSRPMFVTKFNAAHEIQWTNYHGAFTPDQFPNGLAIRNNGANGPEVYIGGSVKASDFPYLVQTGAYIDSTAAGGNTNNGFLFKLDQGGFRLWATYFGNTNTVITSLDMDSQERLVIGGYSEDTISFPTTQPSGSYSGGHAGNVDGFIVQLDENDDLRWGTFLGGSNTDQVKAVRCRNERIVGVGDTQSSDHQPIHPGGSGSYDQSSFGGGFYDLVIAEFNEDGEIQWGTYYGGVDMEILDGQNPVDMGPAGNMIITSTGGASTVVVPGPGWYQDAPVNDRILIEFAPDRSITWTTFFHLGGSNMVRGECVHVDDKGNIFVAGSATSSAPAPLIDPKELPGFFYQPDLVTGTQLPGVGVDAFLMSWTADHWLAVATLFGGEEFGFPFMGAPYTERIATLATTDEFLYAAGTTSKIYLPDTTYFPLYDPGGMRGSRIISTTRCPTAQMALLRHSARIR